MKNTLLHSARMFGQFIVFENDFKIDYEEKKMFYFNVNKLIKFFFFLNNNNNNNNKKSSVVSVLVSR